MFEHERITWLKNIYPEFKEEKRFEENVYRPCDLKYFDFFNREEKQYTTVINPKDIVGIEYGLGYNYYRKINWYELLCNLRRLDHVMNNFKTKKEVIDHIHRHYSENDNKCVWKFGTCYFSVDGQHRLCLAKFLDVQSVEVSVTEFKLDKERLIRYKKIKSIINDLYKHHFTNKIDNEKLIEDSKQKDFCLFIYNELVVIDIDLIPDFIKYYESHMEHKLFYKIQLFINNILHTSEHEKNIKLKTKNDFKKANSLIIKHKMKYYQ